MEMNTKVFIKLLLKPSQLDELSLDTRKLNICLQTLQALILQQLTNHQHVRESQCTPHPSPLQLMSAAPSSIIKKEKKKLGRGRQPIRMRIKTLHLSYSQQMWSHVEVLVNGVKERVNGQCSGTSLMSVILANCSTWAVTPLPLPSAGLHSNHPPPVCHKSWILFLST